MNGFWNIGISQANRPFFRVSNASVNRAIIFKLFKILMSIKFQHQFFFDFFEGMGFGSNGFFFERIYTNKDYASADTLMPIFPEID